MTVERVKFAFVALFFAVLALVGLSAGADYGLPCDESTEQIILQENMLEYALRLFGEDSAPAISKNPYGPHNGSPARHAASWRRRAVQ